jgi:hypothetical protein
MASCSTYLSNKILDWIFGLTPFTPAGTLYLALYSVAPNSDGSGGTELTGNNYSRVSITNNTTNWPNASARQKLNGISFVFPQAAGDWLTAVAWVLFDASTGGNVYTFGKLTTPVTVLNGQSRSFGLGALIQNLT